MNSSGDRDSHEAPRAPATVRSAQLANGVTLQYAEQGNPSGIPAVLIHGGTDSWHSYELVLPYLPDSIRALALTMRGHGDSSRPESGYRYTDFSSDLARFMDVVGLQSAVIVGHSLGRAVAQRFAIDHPERTSGLVLIGAFSGQAGTPAIVELAETVSKFTDPVDEGFVREFQVSTLAQPVPPEFLELVIRESLKVPARVWREMFVGIRDDDAASELGKLTVPTLVLSGDKDGFLPPGEVARVAAMIPGAQLVFYPEIGHALHWEEPARFASDLVAFTG
jgi:non-heme chloroperoxidase